MDWRQFWDTNQLHSGERVALNQVPAQGIVEYGAKAAELDVDSDGRFLLEGLCFVQVDVPRFKSGQGTVARDR